MSVVSDLDQNNIELLIHFLHELHQLPFNSHFSEFASFQLLSQYIQPFFSHHDDVKFCGELNWADELPGDL